MSLSRRELGRAVFSGRLPFPEMHTQLAFPALSPPSWSDAFREESISTSTCPGVFGCGLDGGGGGDAAPREDEEGPSSLCSGGDLPSSLLRGGKPRACWRFMGRLASSAWRDGGAPGGTEHLPAPSPPPARGTGCLVLLEVLPTPSATRPQPTVFLSQQNS